MSADPQLPRGATFRGNLLAELTRLEHSQPQDHFIVDRIDFDDSSTRLTASGHSVEVPAFITAEQLYDALRLHADLRPVSETSWESYPAASAWGYWLILHYDLALLEQNMAEEVPGLHYSSVFRDRERATVTVEAGHLRYRHAVPLTSQPLGIPIELAQAFRETVAKPSPTES